MSEGRSVLDLLADAVADGTRVNWKLADDGGLSPDEIEVARQLQFISRIDFEPHRLSLTPAQGLATALSVAVVALAGLKVLLGAIGAATGLVSQHVGWAYSVNLVVFGATGALLITAGRKDPRARWLGSLFVVIASAFADPLMPQPGHGAIATGIGALSHVPTDSLIGVALWKFVRIFPSARTQPGAKRIADVFLVASAGVAAISIISNVLLVTPPWSIDGSIRAIAQALDRLRPTGVYWSLLFGVALPAIPYLVWKSRFETAEGKRRSAFFIFAVAAGLTPMMLTVTVSPFIPALANADSRRRLGLVLYAALLAIVPSTAYAVLVQRAVALELVAYTTAKYLLARYTVWCLCIGPVTYLLVRGYFDRHLSVGQLLTSARPISLLTLSICGFVTLAFRHQALRAVDRWFQRDIGDYNEVLARFDRAAREATSIRDIIKSLQDAIDRAIRPTALCVFVADEDARHFAPVLGSMPPLSADSAVLDLIRSVRTKLQFNLSDGAIVKLLPSTDQAWLLAGDVHLLLPVIGPANTLLALVALGTSKTGLSYTRNQQMLLTTLAGHLALWLENLTLRELPVDGRVTQSPSGTHRIDWRNEPGVCCPRCSIVYSATTRVCSCGSPNVPAALPLVVQGKFRVERLVGSGGMGVVYQATDMSLDRKVAIKTLPRMTTQHATRLEREAKAMASILHPNLALIYGVERWRGMPLLVVEYLEGGTLAERLRVSPLTLEQTIDLGVVVADVLVRVHTSGVLHRDIKPSNIGYTRDGVPKLLDFGLAALAADVSATEPATHDGPTAVVPAVKHLGISDLTDALSSSHRILGTPLYLSPEAVAGLAPQPSFDLWSLSLLLYEAFAGCHPLTEGTVTDLLHCIRYGSIPDIRRFRPACPPSVASFFETALSAVPEQRPPTAAELQNRLQWLRGTLPLQTQ